MYVLQEGVMYVLQEEPCMCYRKDPAMLQEGVMHVLQEEPCMCCRKSGEVGYTFHC